ncbi:hypothetical protein E2C01_054493 [Portunus trituberculatus]|uniref:Secreted protein n=1 Tax=Portunus trituberculatus TaxID=210409 RepID=A0A5B7GTU5_PORTR|nr:hypothetical protein [Portunus trituberculatus]
MVVQVSLFLCLLTNLAARRSLPDKLSHRVLPTSWWYVFLNFNVELPVCQSSHSIHHSYLSPMLTNMLASSVLRRISIEKMCKIWGFK